MNISRFRGHYEESETYEAADVVFWEGVIYVAPVAVSGVAPSPEGDAWLPHRPAADTRITLAPSPQHRLVTGATYSVVADFSETGRFADGDCRTTLHLGEGLGENMAVAARNEHLCERGRQAWTVWISPYQTYGFSAYVDTQFQEDRMDEQASIPEALLSDQPLPSPQGVFPAHYSPSPYRPVPQGGAVVVVELRASVKNEGWTGERTENVPARWSVRRIA